LCPAVDQALLDGWDALLLFDSLLDAGDLVGEDVSRNA
jgi:hypothetical protein